MSATPHVTPSAAISCFAPAGSSAQLFVVSEGISTNDALEGASMFLSAAADLGAGVDDGSRWAISCFAENAKALIDTIIEARISSNDQGADHGEGAR